MQDGSAPKESILGLIFRGIAMGIAELVPGVSGGTVAFMTGIYGPFVAALASFNLASIGMLKDPKRFWQHHNLAFLVSLIVGMGVGIVTFARLIGYALEYYPPVLAAFFFAVIATSIVHMSAQRTRKSLSYFALPGLAVGIGFVALPVGEFSSSLPVILFAGAIAICAWILPGISGSFVLLLLGLYDDIIIAINEVDLQLLATLACGCALGIIAFARSLAWVLARFTDQLLAFLTGFMASALIKLWPWQLPDSENVFSALTSPAGYAVTVGQGAYVEAAALAGLLGVLALWLMAKLTKN
jgi:putative membrane protein